MGNLPIQDSSGNTWERPPDITRHIVGDKGKRIQNLLPSSHAVLPEPTGVVTLTVAKHTCGHQHINH